LQKIKIIKIFFYFFIVHLVLQFISSSQPFYRLIIFQKQQIYGRLDMAKGTNYQIRKTYSNTADNGSIYTALLKAIENEKNTGNISEQGGREDLYSDFSYQFNIDIGKDTVLGYITQISPSTQRRKNMPVPTTSNPVIHSFVAEIKPGRLEPLVKLLDKEYKRTAKMQMAATR
jgi:hypothetical protein